MSELNLIYSILESFGYYEDVKVNRKVFICDDNDLRVEISEDYRLVIRRKDKILSLELKEVVISKIVFDAIIVSEEELRIVLKIFNRNGSNKKTANERVVSAGREE